MKPKTKDLIFLALILIAFIYYQSFQEAKISEMGILQICKNNKFWTQREIMVAINGKYHMEE
jgi:hypothetical protein